MSQQSSSPPSKQTAHWSPCSEFSLASPGTQKESKHKKKKKLKKIAEKYTKTSLRIQLSLLASRRLDVSLAKRPKRREAKKRLYSHATQKSKWTQNHFCVRRAKVEWCLATNLCPFSTPLWLQGIPLARNLYLSCASLNHVSEHIVKFPLHSPSLSNAMMTTSIQQGTNGTRSEPWRLWPPVIIERMRKWESRVFNYVTVSQGNEVFSSSVEWGCVFFALTFKPLRKRF